MEKGVRRREKWKGRKENGKVRRRKMEGDGGRRRKLLSNSSFRIDLRKNQRERGSQLR